MSRVLHGHADVSPNLAVSLEDPGVGTLRAWLAMQSAHGLALARATGMPSGEETRRARLMARAAARRESHDSILHGCCTRPKPVRFRATFALVRRTFGERMCLVQVQIEPRIQLGPPPKPRPTRDGGPQVPDGVTWG